MSIQNARLAIKQSNRVNQSMNPTETKNNSVKKLNIVGIDKCEWNGDGIVVEYIGRNLSYEEDNYMWEVTDIVDIDNHKEFVLLRNSIEKESKRVWMYSVWRIDDSGMGNKKVLLKSGVVGRDKLGDPKSLIYTILQNTLTDYRRSIQ